jgi:hypothetical protein
MIGKLAEQSQKNHDETKAALQTQREEEEVRYQESLVFRSSEIVYRNNKDIENKEIREKENEKNDVRYQASLDLTEKRFDATQTFNNSLLSVLASMADSVKKLT